MQLVGEYAHRWSVDVPATLVDQARTERPFRFALVRTDVAGRIATLTINRPDAMNALNEDVIAQLEDAFRAASGDRAIDGIVIAGSGKAFIAGADIRFFVRNIEAENLDRIAAFTQRAQSLLRAIESSSKPVVARLHGLALGGGVELALACHAIVATPRASLAFPETGIGIYPGLGGTQRTTKRVGRGLAKWLVFTGQTVTAEEALAIGLVDKVVPYEQLDAAIADLIARGTRPERTRTAVPSSHEAIARFFEAHDVDTLRNGPAPDAADARIAKAVERIGTKAPIALRIAADLIDRGADLPIDEGLRLELSHLREIFSTHDAYEGLSSLGKKTPVFHGR
jgi:enoyl-CoA hydratase/3-hydroxyacyl-CoA dehydrogenase